jgi:predicted nucleic acid-binding protein
VNFAKKEFQIPVKQYHQMIKQGVPAEEAVKGIYLPAVNPFDNHEVHVIEHKNDLLDKFFEYLGTGDPGMIVIANAMQVHWMQHSTILAEQQIRQAIATGVIKREDLESSEEKEDAKPASSRATGS